jgi:hypothetical protein
MEAPMASLIAQYRVAAMRRGAEIARDPAAEGCYTRCAQALGDAEHALQRAVEERETPYGPPALVPWDGAGALAAFQAVQQLADRGVAVGMVWRWNGWAATVDEEVVAQGYPSLRGAADALAAFARLYRPHAWAEDGQRRGPSALTRRREW